MSKAPETRRRAKGNNARGEPSQVLERDLRGPELQIHAFRIRNGEVGREINRELVEPSSRGLRQTGELLSERAEAEGESVAV